MENSWNVTAIVYSMVSTLFDKCDERVYYTTYSIDVIPMFIPKREISNMR